MAAAMFRRVGAAAAVVDRRRARSRYAGDPRVRHRGPGRGYAVVLDGTTYRVLPTKDRGWAVLRGFQFVGAGYTTSDAAIHALVGRPRRA